MYMFQVSFIIGIHFQYLAAVSKTHSQTTHQSRAFFLTLCYLILQYNHVLFQRRICPVPCLSPSLLHGCTCFLFPRCTKLYLWLLLLLSWCFSDNPLMTKPSWKYRANKRDVTAMQKLMINRVTEGAIYWFPCTFCSLISIRPLFNMHFTNTDVLGGLGQLELTGLKNVSSGVQEQLLFKGSLPRREA